MKNALSRLLRVLRKFDHTRRSDVAVTFALAIIPIMGLTGAAIDYGHAVFVQTAMQSALDATALSLSENAATLTNSQLQTNAQNYFAATFSQRDATNVTISPSYSTGSGSMIVVTGSASIPCYFMGIFGFGSITVSASSTVKWGSSRLRVALVLDNTGSMADSGKITALITATNNLLSQLKSAVTSNGDVYVSIIPFVKDVNVGQTNYSASWIDWTDWNAANGTCSNSGYTTQSTCVNSSTGSGRNKKYGTWTVANHNTWNGCVVDRGDETGPDSANYDTNVVAPTTSIMATLFPAEQYSACPQAAIGLSYDWSVMNTLVNNMSPSGNTNQAIGLALGWMSLTGGGPFTAPAMDPNYAYSQVIILLTDGLNTQDRWYSVQSEIDARQTMTCNNIKAAGITLYTIQVSTDGTPTSPLLQQCASTSTKFFLLTSANEIVTTFNAIGTNLSNLYVAK